MLQVCSEVLLACMHCRFWLRGLGNLPAVEEASQRVWHPIHRRAIVGSAFGTGAAEFSCLINVGEVQGHFESNPGVCPTHQPPLSRHVDGARSLRLVRHHGAILRIVESATVVVDCGCCGQ